MLKFRFAMLLGLLVAGCASPVKKDEVPTYVWQGKEGAALVHFGSTDKANQAIEKDAGECSATPSEGSPDFDRCMRNRGWVKMD